LKNKKNTNNELAFYEQKWFKLLFLFSFFGWLFYITIPSFQINSSELTEINVTVKEQWKSEGSRNPIKIYFKTKEYSNRFGIYVGGIFGRWAEVTNSLEENSHIKIKIHKSNKDKLNIESEVIPIYYLNSAKLGLIFDEYDANQGEKSSDYRFIGFLIVIFIFSLWGILND
jgi:predicted DNA-binding protein (MmcQ/YjbR family)